ncbi:hypothetical protein [uncultured Eudoraea sp.]|uniref:hypothetical protein n=1 Tax=uncultured Eudoraea sp. TaxID=1035614 RepID=UPI00260C11A6|nr:hypothetical protein [uncultured Eudoraea sp.]
MRKELYVFALIFLQLVIGCSSDNNNNEIIDIQVTKPRTDIPDIMFERALIELKFDDVEDGSVLTSAIENVKDLVIENKDISSLSGIADFTALEGLWAKENILTTLNVSENSNLKFVYANDNNLTRLNVSDLSNLEKINMENNALTQLDISGNPALQQLSLANNSLQAIDISNIPSLIQLNTFSIENNPLDCIKVNSTQIANIPAQWTKDETDVYDLECN